MSQYVGVDLAWGEGTTSRQANETGFAVLDDTGRILDAGWLRGVGETAAWLDSTAAAGSVTAIDAPLVIPNESGMRDCEREVAACYMRWKVGANASNRAMGWQAGVALRQELEARGFAYADGLTTPTPDSRAIFECYPYTTLVGMEELGYDDERPRYKRLIPGLPAPEARAERVRRCDELIQRMSGLKTASPPLDITSHPETAALLDSPSPDDQASYKHREDLLDAVLCVWTASIWAQFGAERTQVLGAQSEPDGAGRRPTIVAPARPEQRMDDARRTRLMERPADRRVSPAQDAPAAVADAIKLLQTVPTGDPTVAPLLAALEEELLRLGAGQRPTPRS